MTEELIAKYTAGVFMVLLCVAGFAGLHMLHRKHQHGLRSFLIHTAEFIVLCIMIQVLKSYVLMAIEDYRLRLITPSAVELVAVATIGLIAMRQLFMLINRLEGRLVSRGGDLTSAKVIARTLKVAVFVLIVLLFGERLGFSLSGLLAFGGIGGIAIGLAGKDILSNFFSGVMLYFDRPFNIGDWVRSPDRNIEGSVVEVGWRMTKILTFDNRPLYVPNSVFAAISVENPGQMKNRRISTSIRLRYEDAGKIGLVVKDIQAMLEQHEAIDTNDTILVYFDTFAESSLNIMIYCFTRTTAWAAWLAAQQDIYLKIIEIVHGHGADFAFTSRSLYLHPAAGPQGQDSLGDRTRGLPQPAI